MNQKVYENVEYSLSKSEFSKLRGDNTLIFSPVEVYYDDILLLMNKLGQIDSYISEPNHKYLNFYGDIKNNVLIVIFKKDDIFKWWKIRTKSPISVNKEKSFKNNSNVKQIVKKSFLFKPYWDAYTLVIDGGESEETLKEFVWSNRVYLKYNFENLLAKYKDDEFFKEVYNLKYKTPSNIKISTAEKDKEDSDLSISTLLSTKGTNTPTKKGSLKKGNKKKKAVEGFEGDKMSKESMLQFVKETKESFVDSSSFNVNDKDQKIKDKTSDIGKKVVIDNNEEDDNKKSEKIESLISSTQEIKIILNNLVEKIDNLEKKSNLNSPKKASGSPKKSPNTSKKASGSPKKASNSKK